MLLRNALAQVRGENPAAYVPLGKPGEFVCPNCGRVFEYRYCGHPGSF